MSAAKPSDERQGCVGAIILFLILAVVSQWEAIFPKSPPTPTPGPRASAPDYDATRHQMNQDQWGTEDAKLSQGMYDQIWDELYEDYPRGNCTCSSNAYNCAYFVEGFVAQLCYEKCLGEVGYDVHWLDDDGDGTACEALP